MVRGRYGYQPELPASPGAEGVGIVEAVGPGVQGSLVGTRVVFVDTWNTWCEQIVCPVAAGSSTSSYESFDCMDPSD
jgi:NADPH2:quinone reductase